MTEIGHGSVILYAYLWAREYERGEESGRKARPTCVMLIARGKDGHEMPLLFPITSRPPGPGRHAVEIPEIEARRARLYTPAWVMVDEFNTDELETSFAVEDREPLGYILPQVHGDDRRSGGCLDQNGLIAIGAPTLTHDGAAWMRHTRARLGARTSSPLLETPPAGEEEPALKSRPPRRATAFSRPDRAESCKRSSGDGGR